MMKGKGPMMVIAIGVGGKAGKGAKGEKRKAFADGGMTPPKFKQDPEVRAAMSANAARQSERVRKIQEDLAAAERANEARLAAKAREEAAEARLRKATDEAYEAAPKRNMRAGGMAYAEGGKLPMVNKGGTKVPFFAADGKGKMMGGGLTYAKGGMTRDGCAIRGKTKGRFI